MLGYLAEVNKLQHEVQRLEQELKNLEL